jgi:hypothetical protein
MKIAIVGGCFISQHNIPADKLYHQTAKKLLERESHHIVIRTVRYERIFGTLSKIKDLKNEFEFDLLIFHLRAEPVLRMSKLYYKFTDDKGVKRNSINTPFNSPSIPERHDLLSADRIDIEDNRKPDTRLHHMLRELNYYCGTIAGNRRNALKQYLELTKEVVKFCHETNSSLLLIGPASRPFSTFENDLSKRIDRQFSEFARDDRIKYMQLLGYTTSKKEPMFFPNGIHVSQAGHDETGHRLYKLILDDFSLEVFPNKVLQQISSSESTQ